MRAPFDIVTVHGADAHNTWVDLRKRKGGVPIFFGKRTNVDAAVEVRNQNQHTFEKILDIGLGLNVEAWMQSEIDGDSERFDFDEREAGEIQKIPAFTFEHDRIERRASRAPVGLEPLGEIGVPPRRRRDRWSLFIDDTDVRIILTDLRDEPLSRE